jgi:hypothetical protein
MKTFISNMKHAVRNRESVTIGGGTFESSELAAVIDYIERLQHAAGAAPDQDKNKEAEA